MSTVPSDPVHPAVAGAGEAATASEPPSAPQLEPSTEPATPAAITTTTAAPETTPEVAPASPTAAPAEIHEALVCNITLLLVSGKRYPFRIDEKYLAKRNVAIPGVAADGTTKDPFTISVYTLKELIQREWRDDWEARPPRPGLIRLIYFGKLLDDKKPLNAYQFSAESPNVVHLTVRPMDIVDEEEAKPASKTVKSSGAAADTGSRCCVIL